MLIFYLAANVALGSPLNIPCSPDMVRDGIHITYESKKADTKPGQECTKALDFPASSARGAICIWTGDGKSPCP